MRDETMRTPFEYQALLDRHRVRALASEAAIDDIYRAFLGRDPDEAAREIILSSQMTVGDVEQMVRRSPEFNRQGQLLLDQHRTAFDATMLLLHPARILFCPIAKVANTSVKDWALRLVNDGQAMPELSHDRLDSGGNPMQVHHLSFTVLNHLLKSGDWASVALIRNPAERLVSVYCDKFGRNRSHPGGLLHTRPVYEFLNNGRPVDDEQIDRGITFRQFCLYLNHTAVETHDPHWIPQWSYLKTMRWDRLFALDKIESFENFVLDRLPDDLKHMRLGMTNVNPRSQFLPETTLADTLPADWIIGIEGSPPYEAFLTDDIRSFVQNHFSLDFELYARCS